MTQKKVTAKGTYESVVITWVVVYCVRGRRHTSSIESNASVNVVSSYMQKLDILARTCMM